MNKQVIVTTSWDDGDPLDLRVADLLRLRGLSGTFYIPIQGYLGRRTLNALDMNGLRRSGFEIAAHSYSHRSLEGLEDFELQREVVLSRNKLEQALGHPVTMFCYPNGRYDRKTISFLERSGYTGARTTRMLCIDAGRSRFEIPTTLQAFPHSPMTYVKNAFKGNNFGPLAKSALLIGQNANWIEFGIRTFDYVQKHGGVWHLYGHSWELEDYRLWDGLRTLLDYVAGRDGVHYLTNGQLAAQVYGDRSVPIRAAA